MAGDTDHSDLQLLLDSFVSIASERDKEAILEQSVDLARLATRAKYGAAVAVEDGDITAFVHRGMTSAQVAALPHDPRGEGMLGAVLREKTPIRLDVLQSDDRSVGFPLGHVPMAAFLGVPMVFDDMVHGALFLTKPPGQGTFSDEDELFANVLGRQAGTALAGAQLLRQREAELAERRRAELMLRLLQEVAVAANEAATVEDALHECIDLICSSTRWPVGHAFLRDPDDAHVLVSADIWHLDDEVRYAPFLEVTDGMTLRAGEGLPGRVLASRRAESLVDLATAGDFPRAGAAAATGLQAAAAFPVLLEGDIVAVLEFFSPEPVAPEPSLLEVMTILAEQVGRVAERQRAHDMLLRADQMKSDFVSMASHELRTPLTSILGFASTLRSYWDSTADDDKQSYVEVIDRQARRLSRLVNDLLAISRIEAGKVEAHPATIDLLDVVETAVATLGLPPDQLEVVSDLRGGRPDVRADADHVEQIVLNYLSNAVKYGALPIQIRIDDGDHEGFVALRVCDAGEGVPETFRSRLFEKFSQASTGSARRSSGTGLGLSIVKGLAEANGGDAWYEDNEPRGAVFGVRLPRAARA